jgi:hypothetical protein
MKVIHKPHRPVPLIKINHTPQGGDHPIKRKSNIKKTPIKDSKFFRRKPIKNKTKKPRK